jgi:hypothetical protein
MKEMPNVKPRLSILIVAALLAGCSREGELFDGGVYATRTVCPAVGVPAGTGDVTLFNPPSSVAASALDVTATITNVRVACNDQGADVVSVVSFDVVAVRRNATQARQVVLPFFNTVVQGGSNVVAKKVGAVGLDFAAGSYRARTSSQATARVNRAAATLPANVRRILTRPRKSGQLDAAIDPLNEPGVREAVARATFEQLVGFQLSEGQLRYNVTR